MQNKKSIIRVSLGIWAAIFSTISHQVQNSPGTITHRRQTNSPNAQPNQQYDTIEISFNSHDGFEMFGKLVLPKSRTPSAVFIYVQTAEGSTVDVKRPKGKDETFCYYDLYRDKLTAMGIAFFSYEGRGIRMGEKPPRFEQIDWDIFNTGTLDNKVKDALSAIGAVRAHPGLNRTPIWLMGASEATLLAAETASRAPDDVAGLVLYGILATNMRENFRYIMSDGAFLAYRGFFDTDKDGRISQDEFEADPYKYRSRVLRGASFSPFDANQDGFFCVDEMPRITKVYLDAIDNENYKVLQSWAKFNAAVVVPENWFQDHFAHEPIWSFFSKLDIPIGCFHGVLDTNTPIGAVRELEQKAIDAGKSSIEFFYFDELDHSLNLTQYFTSGDLPKGHQAIFEYVRKSAAN